MDNKSWLWEELKDLFDTDDGSLPEISIKFKNSKAVANGFLLLNERATKMIPENATFWSKISNEKQQINSIPNAAALVVVGKAQPFHVILGGIKSSGIDIPDLGIFVFQEEICIDYKMGTEWGPEQLQAFFELLFDIVALDRDLSIELQHGDVNQKKFSEIWSQWIGNI